MSEDTEKCATCGLESPARVDRRDLLQIQCERCGTYAIPIELIRTLRASLDTPRKIANASGWMREHPGAQISASTVRFLSTLRTPTVGERAAKVLQEFGNRLPELGQSTNLSFVGDQRRAWDWVSISWSVTEQDVSYIVEKFLIANGLLDGVVSHTLGGAAFFNGLQITPRGHEELERIRVGGGGSSEVGFCAMWFSPKLLPVWENGIEPAIRAAGYQPQRIDGVEHNNRIDDEIVATIRRSRFVVADFTGSRGGVYFEAGFALGLGIPVIWTIRDGRFHRVHFDNRQYNFISWSYDALPDFRSRLRNRIEATIGRGPIVV